MQGAAGSREELAGWAGQAEWVLVWAQALSSQTLSSLLFLLCLQNRYHIASIFGYPLLFYLVMLLQWEADTECGSVSLPGFSRSLLLNKGVRHTVGGVLESQDPSPPAASHVQLS